MDPFNRAKQVLDICAFELKNISIEAQINLQYAIASVIRQAEEEALKPYLPLKKDAHTQPPLLKISKRIKHS